MSNDHNYVVSARNVLSRHDTYIVSIPTQPIHTKTFKLQLYTFLSIFEMVQAYTQVQGLAFSTVLHNHDVVASTTEK